MPKPPAFDLDSFLPYRLSVVAQRLSDNLARHYRAEFGISTPEWRILAHLAQSDGVSVRDIEQRIDMEKSKASRAASKLVAKGLVTKTANADDRRLLHLTLTPKGQTLLAALLPRAEAFQADLRKALGADADALMRALDNILKIDTP
ncbi:MarR family transcriptional regulator [Amylibacter marinus]|uniref:MarR family transcriptional regulator n=1 Tax=Amylibacter marinus TaxID=1475483 RepID=A0ABQ5VYW4_9RHOB|nr:MarR family winged helix-turn-helix transcriptional regulator [Amylibacter marinus]GLQ36334.1 MarR family transcriptional regulator [Amylibacter marinus]